MRVWPQDTSGRGHSTLDEILDSIERKLDTCILMTGCSIILQLAILATLWRVHELIP